jgi:hypothetical protein
MYLVILSELISRNLPWVAWGQDAFPARLQLPLSAVVHRDPYRGTGELRAAICLRVLVMTSTNDFF